MTLISSLFRAKSIACADRSGRDKERDKGGRDKDKVDKEAPSSHKSSKDKERPEPSPEVPPLR